MDTAFITIVQNLVSEQGKEALFNAVKCKSHLADYTKGEYKKDIRLFLKALEADIAKAIDSTQDIQICKQEQARRLQEEYFLSEEAAVDVVNMLAFVLRGDAIDNKQLLHSTDTTSNKFSLNETNGNIDSDQKEQITNEKVSTSKGEKLKGWLLLIVGGGAGTALLFWACGPLGVIPLVLILLSVILQSLGNK